jgi:hypothetical protein
LFVIHVLDLTPASVQVKMTTVSGTGCCFIMVFFDKAI